MDAKEAKVLLGRKKLAPLVRFPASKSIWKCFCKVCDGSVDIDLDQSPSSWRCRYCSYKPGFKKFSEQRPAILYLVVSRRLQAAKIGVSYSADSRRIEQHVEEGWRVEKSWKLSSGADAKLLESRIIRKWRDKGVRTLKKEQLPQGGFTETALLTDIDLGRTVASVRPSQLRKRRSGFTPHGMRKRR